jgi:hypothetical protein
MKDVEDILAEAVSVPNGPARVDALFAAADQLEAEGQLERAFDLKLRITHVADYAGLHERALEAFAWCRAQQRRDPKRFNQDMLHAHERLVHAMIAKVPLAKFNALIDDFERACVERGVDMYRVYWQRQVVAWFRGDEAEADRFAALMRKVELPPGNCRVCDLNFEIRRIAERGDHELVLEMAEPILSGRLTCGSIPQNTYAPVLYPLLRVGRKEDAERAYKAGYPVFQRKEKYSGTVGLYLRYLALVEDWKEGVTVLERHLAEPGAYILDSYAFSAYQGAWILTRKLERAGHETLAIKLPKTVNVERSGKRGVQTKALSQWLDAEMERIGKNADHFNESDRFARMRRRDAEYVEESFAPRPTLS